MRTVLCVALAGALMACGPRDTTMTMAVDTTAARAGIDSTRARYSQLEMAGDATQLAQLYTEDATLDLYGVPRTRGRAAIEAALKADFGMRKYLVSEVTPGNVAVRTNEDATELGTYHAMHEMNGARDHEWGRYIVGIRKGADGMWRLSYLMAFPDSTKPAAP